MSKRQVTIEDVAKEVGMTKASVSMALRNKPGLAQASREKILDAALRLNYMPSMRHNTRGPVFHGQLGLVLIFRETFAFNRNLDKWYWMEMLHGIMDQAEELGYSLTVLQVLLE